MKFSFSSLLPLIVTVAAAVGTALLNPTFIAAHPALFAGLASVAQILHAVLPSVFGSPQGK